MAEYKFPNGFKWGSATSAYQVEGGNHNNWSEWERSEKRVRELGERGFDPTDFICGKAADHYNRYEEDFDIAKSLHQTIHRLSIEWSRIEPEEGKFDQNSIQHYIDVVKALRERGIEPMVTLWHFTTPTWLVNRGGVLSNKFPRYFTRYVKYVVDNLKDEVELWITFNEATTVYSGMSYLLGMWPPQEKSWFRTWLCNRNIVRAHVAAYKTIKRIYQHSPTSGQKYKSKIGSESASAAAGRVPTMSHNMRGGVLVGITENNRHVVCGKWFSLLGIAQLFDRWRNLYFFSRALPYYDFIGLNYYTVYRLPGSYSKLSEQPRFAKMNWEIYPQGIHRLLLRLRRFRRPIFITENGVDDETKRERFIKDHLYWIWRAIQEGADVQGYLHWSLLDNFEWSHGFDPRFGLVEVDYATMKRTIRPSAHKYAEICRKNSLEY